MKRGRSKQWTVDWGAEGSGPSAPEVGHVAHRFTATGACGGYWRITSVRQVKVRKPLPARFGARYRIGIEEVGEPEMVSWTMHDHPRRPRLPSALPDPSNDRFSPLL